MSDDLDELDRDCNVQGRWLLHSEVLALIERCRKAESSLARWPEAVAKVRESHGYVMDVAWACDRITRLATEKRDA